MNKPKNRMSYQYRLIHGVTVLAATAKAIQVTFKNPDGPQVTTWIPRSAATVITITFKNGNTRDDLIVASWLFNKNYQEWSHWNTEPAFNDMERFITVTIPKQINGCTVVVKEI